MASRSCAGLAAGAALLALWSAPAQAGEIETAEVEGVAAVVKDDVTIARDRAIDDAKRKAVEQVAGSHVSAQSITQNFELVEDKIYARASGFVKNYQILSEFKAEGVYHVKIKASVDKSAIAENLDQIFKVKPRLIVLIAEQNIGSKDFSYWWGSSGFVSDLNIMQNTLIGEWQPKGFKFVDPGMLQGKLKVTGAMKRADLGDDDVLTLSRDTDADVALVGKILVSDAGPVMEGVKMRSFHAVGTLRVLNVDTGEILAVADDTGVSPHIDANVGGRAAIKALAKKIGARLEEQIVAKWTSESVSAREIELVLEGVKSPDMLNAVERVLEQEVRGVESVDVRKRKKGTVYLVVRVRAQATELARELEAKSFGNVKLEIDEVTGARIAASLSR